MLSAERLLSDAQQVILSAGSLIQFQSCHGQIRSSCNIRLPPQSLALQHLKKAFPEKCKRSMISTLHKYAEGCMQPPGLIGLTH